MEQELDLSGYLNVLKRRFFFLVIPAIVVSVGAFAFAQMLPPVYRAQAVILVESQQIPTDLAQSTVTVNASERIQLIEQRLTTRENLLQIVRQFNLFPEDQTRRSPTEIVAMMRAAARIEPTDLGGTRDSNVIGFTVSFDYRDPNVAARVVNELTALILNQNIQVRTARAAQTNTFFEQQVASIEKDLVALEARIVAVKNQNQDALPETLTYRRTQETDLQDKIAALDQQVAALQTQKARAIENPQSANLDPNSTAGELARLRAQLVQMRAVYADSHPEVKRVLNQIQALEAAQNTAPPPEGASRTPEESAASAAAATQIAAIESQITALQKQHDEAQTRLTALQESIARTPQVDVQLAALMRDHDNLRIQYGVAQSKMAEAQTGALLEEDRQAERFEVLEPAAVPGSPVEPNRPRIVMAGSFGGVALGVGLVLLLELLDRSIRDAADFERRLQIRPISTIPYVTTQAERAARRRSFAAFAIALVVVVALLLVAVNMFYMPLDTIAGKITAKFGL